MTSHSHQTNADDIAAVTQAALDYALGVADGDYELIERAYDVPKAQMKLVTGDEGAEKVYVLPIKDVWENIWSQLPRSDAHKVEILSVAVHEGRIANVTLNNNGAYFDYLSLYKVNGRWRIYDKLARTIGSGNIPEQTLVDAFGAQP